MSSDERSRRVDLEGFRAAIRGDLQRLGGGTGIPSLLRSAAVDRNFRAIVTFRLAGALQPVGMNPLALLTRLLHSLASNLAGIELPSDTTIGPGFRVFHGRGLVVNNRARIGTNVSVFGGVTIGRRDHIETEGRRVELGAPTIGDGVWIGPNAIIVGPVQVGDGARIAGGAVVFRDVAPGTIVGGNPATVLRSNAPPDVLHPATVCRRGREGPSNET